MELASFGAGASKHPIRLPQGSGWKQDEGCAIGRKLHLI
jgi:hypothetical protein